MLGNLNGWHAIILLVVILLLFGAPKLPALARSLGQSMKIFKSEVRTPEAEATTTDAADAKPTATGSATPASTEPGDTTTKP